MTTRVTIEVPEGADYVTMVNVFSPGVIDQWQTINPGGAATIYVYGPRIIREIREVKL